MKKTKIAIACQGGGSQTAFTAGVLSALFEQELHLQKRIVSLSGTSGGGICAALAWYGLLKAARGDPYPIHKRILDFWEDILAKLPTEVGLDKYMCDTLRLIDQGMLAHLELSPMSWLTRVLLSNLSHFLPREPFTNLKAALQAHIAFAELPKLVRRDSPVLLLGAADVCSGHLKKFNSRLGEITVEALLASAAVPTLFPAVQIGTHHYWDGLFSDNPPVKELVRMVHVGAHNIPDELWIIQINPTAVKAVPRTTAEIIDRRNQLVGNVSLMQSLEFIGFWNMLLREKVVDFRALAKYGFTRREPVTIRTIGMSPAVQSTLDHVSKLSRESSHIHKLMEDGIKQGRKFLRSLAKNRNGSPEPAGPETYARRTTLWVAHPQRA
jgi:NTE family protein